MVWSSAIHWNSPLTVVAQPWTSFSKRPRSCAQLRCTKVSIAALLLLASGHMLCSCKVHLPLSRGTVPANHPLPRVCDWSVVLTSAEPRLIARHCSVMSAIASHPPDTPGGAPVLDSLFESLTQILCDGASIVAAPQSAAARVCPRRHQPRWWNDGCFHALIARNGSWRDCRRSGSRLTILVFVPCGNCFTGSFAILGPPIGTTGSAGYSLPQRSQARILPHPSDIPFYRRKVHRKRSRP